jgi:hypothetical protein
MYICIYDAEIVVEICYMVVPCNVVTFLAVKFYGKRVGGWEGMLRNSASQFPWN